MSGKSRKSCKIFLKYIDLSSNYDIQIYESISKQTRNEYKLRDCFVVFYRRTHLQTCSTDREYSSITTQGILYVSQDDCHCSDTQLFFLHIYYINHQALHGAQNVPHLEFYIFYYFILNHNGCNKDLFRCRLTATT